METIAFWTFVCILVIGYWAHDIITGKEDREANAKIKLLEFEAQQEREHTEELHELNMQRLEELLELRNREELDTQTRESIKDILDHYRPQNTKGT
jgi:hypothetical protein